MIKKHRSCSKSWTERESDEYFLQDVSILSEKKQGNWGMALH
jgi:hypothetical protein